MRLDDVEKNLLSLPWVKPVKGTPRCEGIKWGSVSAKDLRSMNSDRGTPDRARCKRAAKYVFRATKKLRAGDYQATSGEYCSLHLTMQLTDHEAEYRRFNNYFDKNGWWRNGVFGTHEMEEQE